MELAAQIQSGPSGVSHARMLREFRLMDPKGTGQLDMDDFLGVLSKVWAHTCTGGHLYCRRRLSCWLYR